jgi:hypothetical protein
MRINEIIFMLDFSDEEQADTTQYANEPAEVVIPTATIVAGGTDMNKPKNPSDIRANSLSMYPNYQAEQK